MTTLYLRRVLLCALLMVAGCAFGTNRVTVRSLPAAAMPASGSTVGVRVTDARSELSGGQVGVKRNGYGARTGSVELAGGSFLSSLLTNDLVSILRERGYRADGTTSGSPADLNLTAEIVSFGVDTKMGFWSGSLEGIAVVRVTIVDGRSGQQVWSDVVRADANVDGLQYVSETDHQQVVEKLYDALLNNLRAAIPDGRAPLRPVS